MCASLWFTGNCCPRLWACQSLSRLVWTLLPFSHSADRDWMMLMFPSVLVFCAAVDAGKKSTHTHACIISPWGLLHGREKKSVKYSNSVMWMLLHPLFGAVASRVSACPRCIFLLNKSCGIEWKTDLSMTWSVTVLLKPKYSSSNRLNCCFSRGRFFLFSKTSTVVAG